MSSPSYYALTSDAPFRSINPCWLNRIAKACITGLYLACSHLANEVAKSCTSPPNVSHQICTNTQERSINTTHHPAFQSAVSLERIRYQIPVFYLTTSNNPKRTSFLFVISSSLRWHPSPNAPRAVITKWRNGLAGNVSAEG